MYDLADKTIFITGATAGIGRACAQAAAAAGARLIICGRRSGMLVTLRDDLVSTRGVDCHAMTLDVRNASDVAEAISSLPSNFANIDILVNNAGLASGYGPLHELDPDDVEVMIDTNVKGLLYVTRAVVTGMVERNSGHIINIGSIAGHDVYPGASVYCATKFAVTAITDGLKLDLHGTNIRVSTVDPGLVETDFSKVRFHGDMDRANAVYAKTVPLVAEDVADAVLYVATRPPHVDVRTLILTSVKQSSVTMVDRSGRDL
ncbi:MAG: SDR family NAD(P)-dependent oxidoreductase [Rhodothermales bacterium]|nr:SDR family NAD(P)-dependent oxidoreductase [Rhodothermales bacterium]